MNQPQAADAAHVNPLPAATIDEPQVAGIELLDGGEIIQLYIKPSLWYIPLASARFCACVCLVAAALVMMSGNGGGRLAAQVVGAALLLAAGARVAVASLQWASRLYVLTNRRVLRLSGVLNVEAAECPLAKIGQTRLHLTWCQRLLRLGSIRMTARQSTGEIIWEHVARPGEVYQTVVRAVRKAQSGDSAK